MKELEDAEHGPSIRELNEGDEFGDFSCVTGAQYTKELVYVEKDSLVI